MKITNVHQRLLRASPERVSALLATLGSPQDRLWPRGGWPPMVLDRPLGVGARGGHGPIRYTCEAWEPGVLARFRFARVRGWHQFEILEATSQHCVLEHRTEIDATLPVLLRWFLVIRPLHDACIEDLLSQAEAALGLPPREVPRSYRVRLLLSHFARMGVRKPHAT